MKLTHSEFLLMETFLTYDFIKKLLLASQNE